MGCLCHRSTAEYFLTEFWIIPLRKKSPKEFFELIVNLIKTDKQLDNKNFLNKIVTPLLLNNDKKELSKKLFTDAFSDERVGDLILSLFLITKYDANETKDNFRKLVEVFDMSDLIIDNAPGGKTTEELMFSRERLHNFLSYYVNLISLRTLGQFNPITESEKEQFKNLKEAFDPKIQAIYLARNLSDSAQFKYDELFNKYINSYLSDDNVRNELIHIYNLEAEKSKKQAEA
jgi:hypothetical protein